MFCGCTTILFEGKPVGTPDAGVFWRIISEHKVKSFSRLQPQLEQLKKKILKENFSKNIIYKFDKLFLAGEGADPDTIKWFEKLSNSPVIDHWWQTELVGQ